MKQALSKPSSSSSQSSPESDVEEYQVDNVSTSSCQDESDEEADNTIVVSSETRLPTIESVSVVNSNDVHIGNKTVYKGPVTIKQIVYPNGAVSGDCVTCVEQCDNIVKVKLDSAIPVANGIDNPTFIKDTSLQNKGGTDKDVNQNGNAQHTSTEVEKGFLWLRNLPKKHTKHIVIFCTILIVAITILTAIIYLRHPLTKSNFNDGDSDEQDNNTPVDYNSDSNATINERLRIVPRLQWLAQPPTNPADPLRISPVPLVIIHHTATESCISMAQCIYQVRHIQQFHIESNQWWDIGYNFLVGGDGAAYEGRGWKSEGAHTFGYNYRSIGIAFIGTFTSQVPPKNQIVAFKKLVEKGVELGYIQKDYKLLAARQLSGTESPGAAFMKEIETWPHWSKDV